MSTVTEHPNFVRILKKEVNRTAHVQSRSFISIDNIEFPPLPKLDNIVKEEQQKETRPTTFPKKLKNRNVRETSFKDKDVKHERKASVSNPTECSSNQRVLGENFIHAEVQTESRCHLKEPTKQALASSSYEASPVKPLDGTGENNVKLESEVRTRKGRRKRGKKKKQLEGEITVGEVEELLPAESYSRWIKSTEEYPELDQSKQGTVPSVDLQKLEVKTDGRFRHPSVSAISGGITSSRSHDRTIYGGLFSRSFSDILKATSVPASSSLKFREERVIQDKAAHGASQTPPSFSKAEKQKKNKTIASKQDSLLPKASKEISSLPKTMKMEDGKITKKTPNTSTPLNFLDFIVGVQSGKIKKSRVKSAARSLEEKVTTLTPHNILDSSAPLRKRGKEREMPKKKQMSSLKKIILRERELKKMLLSKELVDVGLPEESLPIESAPLVVPSGGVACQSTIDGLKDFNDTLTAESLEFKSNDALSEAIIGMPTLVQNASISAVDKRVVIAKQIIHSRNFREYCDQFISEEIDKLLSSLLQELVRFQDRLYQKDPTKAKVKRRLVCGLREVTKHLKMKKLKILLIAPNMERINSEGGLDDMLTTLIKLSADHGIPCMFGLSRRKMGSILRKKVPVSCIGVFNYEGTEEIFKPLMEKVKEARVIFKDYFQKICDLLEPELIASLGESISEEEKRDIWRKITQDASPDGWAFESLNKSCRKKEE